MCGIFGTTDYYPDKIAECREALQKLSHRGPDQWNEWYTSTVYLGHRRLSIIDLSENGRQPLVDGQTILTVNGEIYNYSELKKQLQEKYCFKSSSDSEVLLHGYKEWGFPGLLKRIEGMFAIVLYNEKENKLFLARDRVGIKPLYYSLFNNKISWASELKSLAYFYKNKLEVDYSAAYDFLTYLYIPCPKSIYKNIYKLEPAHYIEYNCSSQKIELFKYWTLNPLPCKISIDEAGEQVRHLIRKSVEEQMMSDVPLGFFLSGGIDSSVVVLEASKTGNNISTYSIGFNEKKFDETEYAAQVASICKTNHHKHILNLDTAESLFPELKNWYDEPFADTSAFPTYLVSKFTRTSSTVALSGDGGDELFGGYKNYKRFLKFQNILSGKTGIKIPEVFPYYSKAGKAVNRINKYFFSEIELYAKLMGGMLKHEKKQFAKRWNINKEYDDYWYFKKYYNKDLPVYTRLQYVDFHTYLHDDILTKVDRVSMAVALEVRVPLLSTELIEFCFSLPDHVRIYENNLKGFIKFAYKNELPENILYREKRGFAIPGDKWHKQLTNDNRARQVSMLNYFLPGL